MRDSQVVSDLGDLSDNMRRLVLERTRRLLELDEVLRSQGQPGVLQRREDELPILEKEVLGPPPAPFPPAPDTLTDAERRTWVRRHLRILPGGLDPASATVPSV